MTHCLCYVMIDADTEDHAIEVEVESVLEMYNCHLECAERTEDCHCDDETRPSCENCKGTGSYSITYNPDGLYDWYEIGGRWSGLVEGNHSFTARWALFVGLRPPVYIINGGLDELGSSDESKEKLRALFSEDKDARFVVVDIHL